MNKIKQQIIDDKLEIWQVHQEPVGKEQEELSKEIEEEYVKKTKESIWKPISSTNTTPY